MLTDLCACSSRWISVARSTGSGLARAGEGHYGGSPSGTGAQMWAEYEGMSHVYTRCLGIFLCMQ